MARPRAKLDRLGQADQVFQRLKTEPAGESRERLLAVSHGLKAELGLQQIADLIDRSRSTIQTWFDLYRDGGIERLCRRSETKVGAKHGLSDKAETEFRKKLAKGSFRTAEQAHQWLEKRFGIQRSVISVRRWMGKLGARLKVVRPRHPGSCDQKRFAFRHQMARQAFGVIKEQVPDFRDRPIRLWVADEARFGLQPIRVRLRS